MITFKEDLKEELKWFKFYMQKKKESELEKTSFKLLEQLVKNSPEYLKNDVVKLFDTLSEKMKLNEIDKKDISPLSANFVEKQIAGIRNNQDKFLFELIIKTNVDAHNEFHEFAQQNNIPLVESHISTIHHMNKKIDTNIHSYALTAKHCELLEDFFANAKFQNSSYSGLYCHMSDVRSMSSGLQHYGVDEDLGFLGLNANKFIIRMPTKEKNLELCVRAALAEDLVSALLRNESRLKFYPDQKKSSNAFQFLKLLDSLEQDGQEQKNKKRIKP